jgi:hypothetical protein
MRRAAIVDLQHDDARAVVVRDFVDSGKDRRLNQVAADVDKLFLDLFGIVQAFDSPRSLPKMIAPPPACKPLSRRRLVGVDQPDLELKMGVFAA